MSDVKIEVCKNCNKLFHSLNNQKLCPRCKVEQADEFKLVKSYIRDHKGAGVEEVSSACDVSHKQILDWVREERLYFDNASKVSLPCLRCGKSISIGKYCPDCLRMHQDEIKAIDAKRAKHNKQKQKGDYAFSKGKVSYY